MLVCAVFVYSRFVENPPIWFWEINPSFLRWFYHSWYQSKIRVKHTWKHQKLQLRCWRGMLSPYKDYNSLLKWQANLFFSFMQLRIYADKGIRWFLVCWPYFIIDGIILLFVALIELLELCMLLLLVALFCFLWVACRTWRRHESAGSLWAWVGMKVLVS
jgi:hypothetical protein